MACSNSNQTALINADSIHHSFNKCVTVHETAGTPSRNLVIQNLVCARAVGHLFYEETGNEENVTFQYNLGLGARVTASTSTAGTPIRPSALPNARN